MSGAVLILGILAIVLFGILLAALTNKEKPQPQGEWRAFKDDAIPKVRMARAVAAISGNYRLSREIDSRYRTFGVESLEKPLADATATLEAFDAEPWYSPEAFDAAWEFFRWCNSVYIKNLEDNPPPLFSIKMRDNGMWRVMERGKLMTVNHFAMLIKMQIRPPIYRYSDSDLLYTCKRTSLLFLDANDKFFHLPSEEVNAHVRRALGWPEPKPEGYYPYSVIGLQEGFTSKAKAQAFLKQYRANKGKEDNAVLVY